MGNQQGKLNGNHAEAVNNQPPPETATSSIVNEQQQAQVQGQPSALICPQQVHPFKRNTGVVLQRPPYSEGQKAVAIDLLKKGFSCSQVARMTSPNCSRGNPCRW